MSAGKTSAVQMGGGAEVTGIVSFGGIASGARIYANNDGTYYVRGAQNEEIKVTRNSAFLLGGSMTASITGGIALTETIGGGLGQNTYVYYISDDFTITLN